MVAKQEAVIFGAGVIGCSIAYHLAKQGMISRIIEKDSIAARCSGKSWAIWSYPGGSPLVGAGSSLGDLLWLGYHKLPDFVMEIKEIGGIDCGYRELSSLKVAFTEKQEQESRQVLAIRKEQGIVEGYWMEERDLKKIYPDISPKVRGAITNPCLYAEPYRFTLGLAQVAEKMGVEISQGEVVGFHKRGTKVIAANLASGTTIEGDIFIIALGAWSAHVAATLNFNLPIIVKRIQCLRMEMSGQMPPFSLISPAGQYIIPCGNGQIILGHTGGQGETTRFTAQHNYDFDLPLITEEAKMMNINEALELLPTLEEGELVEQRGDFEGWAPPISTLVANMPGMSLPPVIGQIPGWDNVYIATRFAGHGMMLSLGTGQAIVDIILNCSEPSVRFRNTLEEMSPAKLGTVRGLQNGYQHGKS